MTNNSTVIEVLLVKQPMVKMILQTVLENQCLLYLQVLQMLLVYQVSQATRSSRALLFDHDHQVGRKLVLL